MMVWFQNLLRMLKVCPGRVRSMVDGHSRVEWDVNGFPLWFESRDAELVAAPEAMVCLAFAMSRLKRYRVKSLEEVCPVMEPNLRALDPIWREWWNTGRGRFPAKARKVGDGSVTVAKGVACFFSLGADSFYTVLKNPEVDTVVYVGGYDVPLTDSARLDRIERHFRAAAAELDKKAIFLRSNLRLHPAMRRLPWERGHGAALAAVAHVLSGSIRKAFISSSFSLHYFKPWGTSWKTDHLWSSSSVSLAHTGHELNRFQKIQAIAANPVMQKHLHVCWEHRNDRYNCGVCEKCRRTMLGLLALGHLEHYETLPSVEELVRELRTAEPLVPHIWPTYRSFLEKGLPEEISAATRALLARSGDRSSANAACVETQRECGRQS